MRTFLTAALFILGVWAGGCIKSNKPDSRASKGTPRISAATTPGAAATQIPEGYETPESPEKVPVDAGMTFRLDNAALDENSPARSVVGALSAESLAFGAAVTNETYTLIPGDGANDNSSFEIVGKNLILVNSADFESKASYQCRIRASSDSMSAEKTFNISIGNIPEGPTDLSLSNLSIAENSAPGTKIGDLGVVGADETDYTYSLVSLESTDGAAFSIDGSALLMSMSPNFEQKHDYTIEIKAENPHFNTTKRFVVSVTNVLEGPTGISLSAHSVSENVVAGSPVATLTALLADVGTVTFSLAEGAGDSDNSAFLVSGNQLSIVASPSYMTKKTYSIRLSAQVHGITFSQQKTIAVFPELFIQNRSEADQARFQWDFSADSAITNLRIAYGQNFTELSNWNGNSDSSLTNGNVITHYGGCTGNSVQGTATTLFFAGPPPADTDQLSTVDAANSKCGITMATLPLNQSLFVRFAVDLSSGGPTVVSRLREVRKSPSGMVFVSNRDWPATMPENLVYDGHTGRYNFFIDKYAVYEASGSPLVYKSSGAMPYSAAREWSSYADGCSNRTQVFVQDNALSPFVGSTRYEKFHLMTSVEYYVAAQGGVNDNALTTFFGVENRGMTSTSITPWTNTAMTYDSLDLAQSTYQVRRKVYFGPYTGALPGDVFEESLTVPHNLPANGVCSRSFDAQRAGPWGGTSCGSGALTFFHAYTLWGNSDPAVEVGKTLTSVQLQFWSGWNLNPTTTSFIYEPSGGVGGHSPQLVGRCAIKTSD